MMGKFMKIKQVLSKLFKPSPLPEINVTINNTTVEHVTIHYEK